MCGIVGIVSSDDVNQQIYDSLLLLQHRGQDSTGIATMENTIFHIHKAKGQVNTAYRTRDMRNLIGKIGYVSNDEILNIKIQDKDICNIRVEELTEKFNNSISGHFEI